jgi:hypothetical protein
MLEKAIETHMYDCVFCRTPMMRDIFDDIYETPSFVLPLGWDPDVYGLPNFNCKKQYKYVYYGTGAGKRAWAVPELMRLLAPNMANVSGPFGSAIPVALNMARANLYIEHSSTYSYSSWRIWQTLASSACLVTEPGDYWPLEENSHVVEIDQITRDNIEHVADDLKRILKEVDLLSMAKLAHEEVARKYTSEYCINKFLVPAGAAVCGR